MVGPVAVVLQVYETPPVAVSVAVLPAQTEGLLTVGAGSGLNVGVPLAVAVQPVALVAVTVYVPTVSVMIVSVVDPVFQR